MVHTLSGLLPICSWCKKIRDDQGYWKEVETCVSTHSEVHFSHAICPACEASHFPTYVEREKDDDHKDSGGHWGLNE